MRQTLEQALADLKARKRELTALQFKNGSLNYSLPVSRNKSRVMMEICELERLSELRGAGIEFSFFGDLLAA